MTKTRGARHLAKYIYQHLRLRRCCHARSHPDAWRLRLSRASDVTPSMAVKVTPSISLIADINFKGSKGSDELCGHGGQHVCATAVDAAEFPFLLLLLFFLISASLHKHISAGLAETAVISFLCCMCVSDRWG